MSNSNRSDSRNFLKTVIIAAVLFAAAIAGPLPARAAGVCALVPNDKMPSEKMLQCGDNLTVRATPGASRSPSTKVPLRLFRSTICHSPESAQRTVA